MLATEPSFPVLKIEPGFGDSGEAGEPHDQLAAISGATTRELMRRMGHASMRAAPIYQHASDERDRAIADSLGAHVERARPAEEDEEGQEDDDAAAS